MIKAGQRKPKVVRRITIHQETDDMVVLAWIVTPEKLLCEPKDSFFYPYHCRLSRSVLLSIGWFDILGGNGCRLES